MHEKNVAAPIRQRIAIYRAERFSLAVFSERVEALVAPRSGLISIKGPSVAQPRQGKIPEVHVSTSVPDNDQIQHCCSFP